MRLVDALGVGGGEVVSLVGGGGKTAAMFRLAREIVARGERALTTTTTHIFAAQIAQAPAHVIAVDATPESVAAALAAHGHVLVVGATDAGSGRAGGVSLDLFARLRGWCPGVCIVNEADGSRMRLDGEHVHRPELVSALSGAPLGTPITPEIVASVLAHPEGGRKGVPRNARVIVVINKVESLPDKKPARETAERLLREPAIQAVALAAVRGDDPVLEVCSR